MYEYKAECSLVIDGDTIVCNIDLGLQTLILAEHIRFARIDCRPLYMEKGVLAKEHVQSKIEFQEFRLTTIEDTKGKYGRYLGEIFYYEGTEWINLNDELVSLGLAVYVEY